MNTHIKNWLNGVAQVLVLYPEQDYQRPQRGDFKNDVTALRGDATKIANGLRKNTAKHGKIDTSIC